MARLTIDLGMIADNFRRLRALCARRGRELVAVTKLCQSNPAVVGALKAAGAWTVAETNLRNLERIPRDMARMLLRTSRSDIQSGLSACDSVLLSELDLAEAVARLPRPAEKAIYITVEGGDNREGVNPAELAGFVKKLLGYKKLALAGIAVNYGCLRGMVPSPADAEELVDLVRKAGKKTGFPLRVLSFGGTAVYDLLALDRLPEEVNQIRMGEAVFFGHNMSLRKSIPGLHHQAFRFSAEIIEIKEKKLSSDPPPGYNAFGLREAEPYQGTRKRAVLDFGELAAPREGLTPLLAGIALVGATHDYAVIDVTDCSEPLSAGDTVDFAVSYTGAAQAMLSPFVQKTMLPIVREEAITVTSNP